jgi:hypothetical protein
MFFLTFVFNKMSFFQMEFLKFMEKFDGGNFSPLEVQDAHDAF